MKQNRLLQQTTSSYVAIVLLSLCVEDSIKWLKLLLLFASSDSW